MNTKKNKIFGIVLVLIIFTIVALYVIYTQYQKSRSKPPEINTGTTSYVQDATFNESVKASFKQASKFLDKESKIGAIVPKLPYQGTNFRFTYSFKTADFTLGIKSDKKTEGMDEFKSFLKKNYIEDVSQIRNLVIEYY